jgi:hypothetical protein
VRRRVLPILIFCFLGSVARPQGLPPFGPPMTPIAAGTGGSGGVTSVSTICPASGPSTGAVTIGNGITPRAATGGTDTLLATDCGGSVKYSYPGAVAITVPQAGTTGFGSGFFVTVAATSATGTLTFTTSTSTFSTGGATFALTAGQSASLSSDGTNWIVYRGAGTTLTLGTGVAAALADNVLSSGSFTPQNGSIASGDCLKWSTTSGVTDAGAACGSGGSSTLTVGSTSTSGGAAGQIMFDSGSVLEEQAGFGYSSGLLTVQNGATAQGLDVYNTYTSATSYERGVFDWTTNSNVLTIGTQKGSGGGSARNLEFVVGGTDEADYGITTSGYWTFVGTGLNVGGTAYGLFNVKDNSANIKFQVYTSGNDVTLASNELFGFYSGTSVTGVPDTSLTREAAGVMQVGTSSANANGSLWAANIRTATAYSVAGTALPTCNAAAAGTRAYVTDATSPTYLGTYTSGGGTTAPVFCNGSNWVTD